MSTDMSVDPAFKLIPKNSTFFLIWRIEKLNLVAMPKENYGTFYTGDSYIVAVANDGKEKIDSTSSPREAKPEALNIAIHFWLGEQTSQDEAGIAAYKTVELDDYFGGSPVQYREVQGHESQKFLAYFRAGMRLLEGGVASGFNHVERNMEPRLFHIKGKRIPIIKQCKEIKWSALNHGDVFILDAITYIYLWSGRTANYMEKIHGAKIVQQFKGEHGPDCNSVIMTEDGNEKSDLKGAERELFEKYLPLSEKDSQIQNEISDVEIERKQRTLITLYRCTDENDALKVIEVKQGPLEQTDLISDDSFIIDNGEYGIWVWIGKKASAKERVEAMRNAQGFLVKKGYPNHTQITRVIDGAESIEFKSLFKKWLDHEQQVGIGKTYSAGGRIAKIKSLPENRFDVKLLHENQSLAAEIQMVDDGSGEKKVYRVKSFDLIEVEKNDHGNFFTGDCYLITYTYNVNNRENVIIYYWIGNNASVDEKGTVAMKTVEIDEKQFHGKAMQVRVAEGKEPPHFTAMFGGQMIIFKGGFQSGFRFAKKTGDVHSEDKYLLHVRGTNRYITRATEVDCDASSLNSNDVFVLHTPTVVYIWSGKGSTGDEREMAKECAQRMKGKEIISVVEGQEKNDFWEAIGGRKEYANDKILQTPDVQYQPRLFQCSNASGYFSITEIMDFQQTDLIEDDVMLLDTWDALFLWIGEKSNQEERKQSLESAVEYLRSDPRDRDLDTPIATIKQGSEPANFTGFFGAWNTNLWQKLHSYDEIKRDILQQGKSSTLKLLSGNSKLPILGADFDTIAKYPVNVLKAKDTQDLPENVDPSRKEIYLSNTEFNEVFGMSYTDFQQLPKWKQIDLKKKVGLF